FFLRTTCESFLTSCPPERCKLRPILHSTRFARPCLMAFLQLNQDAPSRRFPTGEDPQGCNERDNFFLACIVRTQCELSRFQAHSEIFELKPQTSLDPELWPDRAMQNPGG